MRSFSARTSATSTPARPSLTASHLADTHVAELREHRAGLACDQLAQPVDQFLDRAKRERILVTRRNEQLIRQVELERPLQPIVEGHQQVERTEVVPGLVEVE